MDALAALFYAVVEVYMLVIVARVLMSWFQVDPYSPLAQTIFKLTEPILAPVRNLIPPAAGFDFSPIVVIILLQVLASIMRSVVAG